MDDYNAPTQSEPTTTGNSEDYDYMQRYYAGEDLGSDQPSTDPYTHNQPSSYDGYDKYDQQDSYAPNSYDNYDSYNQASDVPVNYETHPYE